MYTSAYSVLRKATQIEDWPFPHIVVENALPYWLYDKLKKTRPEVPHTDEQNKRFDIPAKDSLEMELDPMWKGFISYHCSQTFYDEANALFHLDLNGTAGIRRKDKSEIQMDCQISINTPSEVSGRVCIAHRDNPESRWSGLFYMGTDDAGLEIYDCPKPQFFGKRRVLTPGDPIKTIPFKDNTFIGFTNVVHSIHAPESRLSEKSRKFVNFCIDQKL